MQNLIFVWFYFSWKCGQTKNKIQLLVIKFVVTFRHTLVLVFAIYAYGIATTTTRRQAKFSKMPISIDICDIRKNLEKLNNLVLEGDNNETIRNSIRIPEGM